MKIRRALLALVSVATVMGITATQPAEASTIHNFRVDGVMDIVDDEIINDEHCPNRNFFNDDTADHANPHAEGSPFKTCGGEIRIVVFARGELVGERFCNLSLDIMLYEGTSITTNDLDGHLSWDGAPDFCISKGGRIFWENVRIHNTAEGGDYADLDINIRHLN